MTNEEVLQGILNSTIQRFGKHSSEYELEVANLTGQVLVLNSQIADLKSQIEKLTENSKKKNAG